MSDYIRESMIFYTAPLVESPIEGLFLMALLGMEGVRVSRGRQPHRIERQLHIGRFRVDFLITTTTEPLVRVVVECDGHDYHERTAEQATRDRSRDRELQAQGYKVFRFTGREIHADPYVCAVEVLNLITVLQQKGSA